MCSGSCNSQFRGSLLFGRYQWDLDLWGRISPALTEEVELLKRVLGNAALWRAWSRGQLGVSGETRQGGEALRFTTLPWYAAFGHTKAIHTSLCISVWCKISFAHFLCHAPWKFL